MTRDDAVKFFGSQSELARRLEVTRSSVSQWNDGIPLGRQYQIEVLTKGKLKADRLEQLATA